MVVKTVKCVFSEKEIYPGTGCLQITKGGRQLNFISSKSKSLFNQGKKPAKIVWTRNWRVLHKKITVVRENKRIKKKTKKVQRKSSGLETGEFCTRRSPLFEKTRGSRRKRRKFSENRLDSKLESFAQEDHRCSRKQEDQEENEESSAKIVWTRNWRVLHKKITVVR